MVRLVFRPYTQIWPLICTSKWMRTATRISPGFILSRHSSPSFGYYHVCSHVSYQRSNLWGSLLAQLIDSLVRVSRRDIQCHWYGYWMVYCFTISRAFNNSIGMSISSFTRVTFTLSVSCWYLALDEIYHPDDTIRVAFPNNSTRLT